MAAGFLEDYPPRFFAAISDLARRRDQEVFVVGGTVRDWLRGHKARDLDLAVRQGALSFARELARAMGGTFVPLDPQEGVARVVRDRYVIDVADFRAAAGRISEDLVKRDFTMNAMALPFDERLRQGRETTALIDPAGGRADLERGVIRALAESSFLDDPLRLLRAYRFLAETGFAIEPRTGGFIERHRELIGRVSAERVAYELNVVMESGRSRQALEAMAETGLFAAVFPEMAGGGDGLRKREGGTVSAARNLETLGWLERILAEPERFFPGHGRELAGYLREGKRSVFLKWAALFTGEEVSHDLTSCRQDPGHDNGGGAGVEIFSHIAERLRMSNRARVEIDRLIMLRDLPGRLLAKEGEKELTARDCLTLHRQAADALFGLFPLALARSLARQPAEDAVSEGKEIARLCAWVIESFKTRVEPVLAAPPLVTGRDLIELGLTPGPRFKEILAEIEGGRVTGEIMSREQAVRRVRDFLEEA